MSARDRRVASGRAKPSASAWLDPGAQGEHLGLEDFPTFLFARIANAMQRDVVAGYLDEFGLNAPQWRALAALASLSPLPFGDLVRLSMSDKALVSRSVQALAAAGLIAVGDDPGHGKRRVCRIRRAGRALYERVLPRAQAAQAGLLDLLEPAERVALHGALLKLRSALDSSAVNGG